MLEISLSLRLQLSLIIVIGAACLKPHSWSNLLVYGAIALVSVFIFQIDLRRLGSLLGGELIFLSLVALPLGWEKASFLLVRSLICLIVMNSFLLTLPPHSFGIALKGLPLPAPLKENLLLAGQYLEILLSEVNRMQRSAQLRGLNRARGWLRYASAAIIGSLYLRTLDRAERVYSAMIARGYKGQTPIDSTFNPKEGITLITVAMIATCITISSYL